MTRFLPSTSAVALSRALFQLSKPAGVSMIGRTTHRFGWKDDVHGARWILWDDECVSFIHPQCSLSELVEILQPFVGSGQLSADALSDLQRIVDEHRGQSLRLWEAVPQLFKDMSKTHAETITAGLLPSPFTP